MADPNGQQAQKLLEAPHELALPAPHEQVDDEKVAAEMKEAGTGARGILSQIDEAEKNQQ